MKDASIPLSIAFIQSDGKIVQIRPMRPYDETPVPSLSDTVAYALLVNQGWFERLFQIRHLQPGAFLVHWQ